MIRLIMVLVLMVAVVSSAYILFTYRPVRKDEEVEPEETPYDYTADIQRELDEEEQKQRGTPYE